MGFWNAVEFEGSERHGNSMYRGVRHSRAVSVQLAGRANHVLTG
jgi:hypothetical protein